MQPTSPSIYLVILAFAGVFLVLWAGSIALVAWDSRRRKLDRLQRWLGIGLCVALPIAGFFAYWMILLIERAMQPAPQPEVSWKRRETQPMPAIRPQAPRTTIPAAEMIHQSTIAYNTAQSPAKPMQSAVKPVYSLHVLEGPNAGADFQLNHFPACIGRSSVAMVLLDKDLKVSRQHAELIAGQGGIYIRDLGSLHGSQVNGRPIQDQPLTNGDRIRLGDSTLLFQVTET
jgi:pSer/pThr/pTyr-binding forkhead associated (FHA) protein